jgi:hypothetical protein
MILLNRIFVYREKNAKPGKAFLKATSNYNVKWISSSLKSRDLWSLLCFRIVLEEILCLQLKTEKGQQFTRHSFLVVCLYFYYNLKSGPSDRHSRTWATPSAVIWKIKAHKFLASKWITKILCKNTWERKRERKNVTVNVLETIS